MKDNEEKKENFFNRMKTEVKELFGADTLPEEMDTDTGIVDFTASETEEAPKEKPKKSFFENMSPKKTKAANTELFNQEEEEGTAQTVFVDPNSFEEGKKIIHHIMKNKMITINLEFLNNHEAQRLVDFLAGAMKIKEASFVKISKKIYTIVPKNMKVYYEGRPNRKTSILEFEREE